MMIARLPVFLRVNALAFLFGIAAMAFAVPVAFADVDQWEKDWPRTDFSKNGVDLEEIFSGGVGKDAIPAIDEPTIGGLAKGREVQDEREPIIRVTVNGQTRGYPLTVLIWHEIVNDELGGVPIAVTYCPLCNTAIVFDRRVEDQVLDFGTTGNLRFPIS